MPTINITAGYKKNQTTFYLRMVRMHEETAFGAKLLEVKETDPVAKADAEMAVLIETIASWSTAIPTDHEGKPVNSEKTTSASVKKLFADMEPIEAERIANSVIYGYQSALRPDVVF